MTIISAPFNMNGDGPFKNHFSCIYDYKFKELDVIKMCSTSICKREFKHAILDVLKYEEKTGNENIKKYLEFFKDKECGLLSISNDDFNGYFYCISNKSWYKCYEGKEPYNIKKVDYEDIIKSSKYFSENISSEKLDEDTEKEAKKIKQTALTAASKFHLEKPEYNIIDKFRLFDKPGNLKNNRKFIGYYKNSDNTKKFIEWMNKICDKNKLVELETKIFSGGKNIAIYVSPISGGYIYKENSNILARDEFESILEECFIEGYNSALEDIEEDILDEEAFDLEGEYEIKII